MAETPNLSLSDGVVTLRPPDERDLDALELGIHDPDVVRWIGPANGSAADVLALNRVRAAHGSPTFAICLDDGACVGHVWLNVRYWLLPAVRGRGLATRSVRLISDWAVEALGIRTLRLTTEPDNLRSQAVAERSGFTRIGVLEGRGEIAGRKIDLVLFERLPRGEPD
jgi:RimJ/RimL family protein N-acetyltransferase